MASEEAGPSGAGTRAVPQVLLDEADNRFQQGVQAIKDTHMEAAVGHFAAVLESQDSADVFAGAVGGGSEEPEGDKENDDTKPAPSAAAAAAAAADKGKGKAPAVEASDEEEGQQEQEEGGSGGAAEQAESDLQLAWENLETAKVIWQREADKHTQELANVHLLLSDVAMESDDFDTALTGVRAVVDVRETQHETDRRIAEAEYKRCMALQFSNRPQEALDAVQAAVACLKKKQAALQAQEEAAGEGVEDAKLAAELEDVAAVLVDLQDKVAELEGVLGQLGTAMGAGSSGSRPPSERLPAQQGQQHQGAAEQAGFDKRGSAAPAAPAAPSGAVQNLGVVGRGTKRIKLQPLPAGGPTAVATVGGQSTAAAGAAAGEPAKKKRSLEDLMGGQGSETTVGFGAPAVGAAPKAAAPTSEPATAAPPALPAFLQSAKVQEVYDAGQPAAN
eukprot:scaffold2.g7057.t1